MSTQETINDLTLTKEEILNDYRILCESRQASILGRKEVFAGKAKFGIFGTGKELAQIAMAKYFRFGDFRSGYYRDQTFMMAIDELSLEQYYAQLYAHTDIVADPASGGRLMIGHYATRSLDNNGHWNDLTKIKNSSPDISPTGAQMPRLVGLAYASKLYRLNPELKDIKGFSNNGNEVAFGTIGNAATAEGIFFEAINAAGVLQIPMVVSIWDDGYGISVPQEYQTTKVDISKMFEGFKRTESERGIEIFKVKGWNYEELCRTYRDAAQLAREHHVPSLVHVEELAQPLGHSTSGSHERYKSKERLAWEEEFDCNKKFKEWILENSVATLQELKDIEDIAFEKVKRARQSAWNSFVDSMKGDLDEALALIYEASSQSTQKDALLSIKNSLEKTLNPIRSDAVKAVKKALKVLRFEEIPARTKLIAWVERTSEENFQRYSSHIFSHSDQAALKVKEIKPEYKEDSPFVDGREVLQANFEALLLKDPRIFAFGEDVGMIGDVNQGFAGLQEKFGTLRIMDTGIRETSIIGQGLGAAMRGLRPIAEIQYLDYLLFAIQTLSDDLATLHYRTVGGQKAPMIIRTRGHRLEGVWHSGSPISMILGSLRGVYLLVPRNMTQAAGFYNTMLKSDDPALIIETLNGYRLKEKMPSNLAEFTVPLGVPEVLKEGSDVTIVTYGAMCKISLDAAAQLEEMGISAEVIDVQSLMPFDIHHFIAKSVKKTNRVIFTDEDVPGGGTAFMMKEVLETQKAYQWLDSAPRTLPAKEHRPAYSSDGDYFSKPNAEELVDLVYEMMNEADPVKYPSLY
ncbi:alpha-ketoacid dehydrogenase subunit alpha/beta [Sporocytophaga myxococcoides]|uniref:alpha-ketoacid dehydrogenase subunit alpha/beta n=1 Tax=Sporocytophaga myxococcoides TaxID=153721 RepID=UPI00040E2633|nr:alpha-ketoacid dehydrogenase subunit alpha/beta [Sporocytophaga myxococcoides]